MISCQADPIHPREQCLSRESCHLSVLRGHRLPHVTVFYWWPVPPGAEFCSLKETWESPESQKQHTSRSLLRLCRLWWKLSPEERIQMLNPEVLTDLVWGGVRRPLSQGILLQTMYLYTSPSFPSEKFREWEFSDPVSRFQSHLTLCIFYWWHIF